MENIIFEEVNNKRTKYIDLPELIKGAIDFQPCCRELCERKIKWHFDQKEILYNYVILSNDEILWWCSKILYTEHAKIKRDGLNLVYKHQVSFYDAIFGASMVIPALDGDLKFAIDKGTQSGKVFRLKGKGLMNIQPQNGGPDVGDMLVEVQVYTPNPKELNEGENEIIKKLKNLESFKPKN